MGRRRLVLMVPGRVVEVFRDKFAFSMVDVAGELAAGASHFRRWPAAPRLVLLHVSFGLGRLRGGGRG